MNRVAVQLGTARLRVAIADPRPRLLAELPVPEAGPCRSGPRRVHRTARPACRRTPRGAPVWARRRWCRPTAAAVVRFVPAAVAALASVDAATTDGADRPVPDAVVVDVGHRGADVAHVAGGRIVAARRVPVGGAVLDAVTAELVGLSVPSRRPRIRRPGRGARRAARRCPCCRRSGPGMPPVDLDARRAARRADPARWPGSSTPSVRWRTAPGRTPPPVLLVGGVARTPLLAELLDAAGVPTCA